MSTGPETDVVDFADQISESFPLSRNHPPILPSLPRDAVIIKSQRFVIKYLYTQFILTLDVDSITKINPLRKPYGFIITKFELET